MADRQCGNDFTLNVGAWPELKHTRALALMDSRKGLRALVACVTASGGLAACGDPSGDNDARGGASHLNAGYFIEGQRVTLVEGLSDTESAPGSAARIVTRYFGNELSADLDGDGRSDTVFILTQDTGGSGTFFYVVAAIDGPTGFVGSHGRLLGDRIAPQSTSMGEGNIINVNYAERAPGETFAVPPSVGRTLRLRFNPVLLQFDEVAVK